MVFRFCSLTCIGGVVERAAAKSSEGGHVLKPSAAKPQLSFMPPAYRGAAVVFSGHSRCVFAQQQKLMFSGL